MFLRRLLLASTLTLIGVPGMVFADAIGVQSTPSLYALPYSPASSPFEAFEWTPLEFAAFQAYGGDFANVRKPVAHIYFFEVPFAPGALRGPDDELVMGPAGGPQALLNIPFFEALPYSPQRWYDESLEYRAADDTAGTEAVPEPSVLALIGLGMLGASHRLRRRWQSQR